MHNAIKGVGIGVIVLGTYFGIVGMAPTGDRQDNSGAANAAETQQVSEPASSETEVRTLSILEQAILDAFPADGAEGSQDAKDFVAASINTKGYLCADPIQVVKAQTQERIYGVQCVTNRDGSGISGYIVDVGTGLVMPIE